MAILPILRYPDPFLREATSEVPAEALASEEIRRLVEDMTETMYSHNGAGLAAIQVGRLERIILIDGQIAGGPENAPPLVFVNPVIEELSKETETADEGCLSFPGVFVPVKRAKRARVSALGLDGRRFTVEAEGLYARALQHECDHLNGRLLADFVGPVKRELIKRKMKRLEREEAEEAAQAEKESGPGRGGSRSRTAESRE